MVAFVPANLPSGCNTVEKVNAWSGSLLATNVGNTRIIEEDGYQPTFVATVPIAQTPDHGVRMVTRVSMPMEPGYSSAGGKLWTQVREISTAPIPAAFLTN